MFASTLWLDSRLEKAFMLIGSGRNGKSITLMTLQDIIGYRSISNVSIHDLINNRFKLAKLEGKLLNIYPDIRAREIEESGVLKPIISGERITVENKMVDVRLTYDKGLDRYYGLLDLAEKHGIFKKVSTRFELPDGSKQFGKTIMNDPETYFTDDVMTQLEVAADKEFRYG